MSHANFFNIKEEQMRSVLTLPAITGTGTVLIYCIERLLFGVRRSQNKTIDKKYKNSQKSFLQFTRLMKKI